MAWVLTAVLAVAVAGLAIALVRQGRDGAAGLRSALAGAEQARDDAERRAAATASELEERGITVNRVGLVAGAGRQAFLADPDGHQIELNQPGS